MTEPIHPDPSRSALLIIDMQPDFMPGGALPVQAPHPAEIIAPVRALMGAGTLPLQIATQDWHPPGHISFASRHDDKQPFDEISLHGHAQTLWPDHCVQGSAGAELHGGLDLNRLAAIIRKGDDPDVDSYSGFHNNWDAAGERPSTGLAGYLRDRGVDTVFCCGLARDVCVKWTAEDAAAAGFTTRVIWDLTWPVDADNDAEVRDELGAAGVVLVDADQLLAR